VAALVCPRRRCAPPWTLWLELRPFRVHVVEVVPRAVRSGLGHTNTAGLAAAKHGEWPLYWGFTAVIE
jgi:hypothetical protein